MYISDLATKIEFMHFWIYKNFQIIFCLPVIQKEISLCWCGVVSVMHQFMSEVGPRGKPSQPCVLPGGEVMHILAFPGGSGLWDFHSDVLHRLITRLSSKSCLLGDQSHCLFTKWRFAKSWWKQLQGIYRQVQGFLPWPVLPMVKQNMYTHQ